MELAEAKRVFLRRAEDVLEQAEGIRLGMQVIQMQDQIIQKQAEEIKEQKTNGTVQENRQRLTDKPEKG